MAPDRETRFRGGHAHFRLANRLWRREETKIAGYPGRETEQPPRPRPQASTSPTTGARWRPALSLSRAFDSLTLSLSAYALFFSPHLLRQMSHAPIKNNGGRAGAFPPHASPNQAREQQPVLGASSARGVSVTRRFTLRARFSLLFFFLPSVPALPPSHARTHV